MQNIMVSLAETNWVSTGCDTATFVSELCAARHHCVNSHWSSLGASIVDSIQNSRSRQQRCAIHECVCPNPGQAVPFN